MLLTVMVFAPSVTLNCLLIQSKTSECPRTGQLTLLATLTTFCCNNHSFVLFLFCLSSWSFSHPPCPAEQPPAQNMNASSLLLPRETHSWYLMSTSLRGKRSSY